MQTTLPGPSSLDTLLSNPGERLAYQANVTPNDSLVIILQNRTLETDHTNFVEARESLYQLLRNTKRIGTEEPLFTRVQTVGHTQLDDETFRSLDKHALLIQANTNLPLSSSGDELEFLPKQLERWIAEHPQYETRYLSGGTTDTEMFALIERDLDRSLLFTLPLTLGILLLAFGSFAAALTPLVMALFSLGASLGTCALLSHVWGPISATASQLVVLLVLAIGVDYCLFTIYRVREELRDSDDLSRAISVAQNTTGRAVFWSGVTVALSLFGLLLMNDSILCSMAFVSIVAVIITVFGCICVLPAVLLLLGHRLALKKDQTERFILPSTMISKWVQFSVHNPFPAFLLSTCFLLSLASFAGNLHLGSTIEANLLPTSLQSTRAYEMLEKQFPKFAGIDFSLILHAPNLAELDLNGDIQNAIDKFHEHADVKGPLEVRWSKDETLARYEFIVSGSGNDPVNLRFFEILRKELLPQHLQSIGVEAYLSGTLPYVAKNKTLYSERSPIVFGAVLLCSLFFLLAAFHSLIVPLKAVILNLLSAAASFGVLVLCFQTPSLGTWDYGIIEGFVPALLFSILFGLSMDYHVFLLSRVREEVLRGASTRDAVERGIAETSGAITSAALIMVTVFVIISSLELPIMKQLGVGLAVAVLLDATIVRSMLLPASMILLGEWNWYLPKLLQWIPQIHPEQSSAAKEESRYA